MTAPRRTLAEQLAAFGDMLERIFDEGVARFGSVDGFAVALDRYNAERRALRAEVSR